MITDPTPLPSMPCPNLRTRVTDLSHSAINPVDIAEQLRSLSNHAPVPDLYEIARRLRVAAIRTDSTLDRLGHTTWGPQGPYVALQDGQKTTRKRFTLAHELAHIYLGHGRNDEHPHGQPIRNARVEERLADAIAGHLLVPSAEVLRLRDLDPTIADIRNTADRLGVSQSVVVRQLHDADRTRHWLLINLKRATRGSWHFWRVTGRIRGLDSTMRIVESEQERLDRIPELDVHLQLLTRVGDLTVRLEGTGNRRSNLTLMLVDHVRPFSGTP